MKKIAKQQSPPRTVSQAPPPIKPLSGSGPTRSPFTYKKPDYEYWKKMDLWTLWEAVCLLCDCDPEHRGNSDKLTPVYKTVTRSVTAGALKIVGYNNEVYPRDFVKWARGKGLPIPRQLEELSNQTQKPQNNSPAKGKIGVTKRNRLIKKRIPDWRGYAKKRRENDPDITKAEVIRSIQKQNMGMDSKYKPFVDSTIRRQIVDLWPEDSKKSGRRPKTS